jgi:hypothetical protein
VGLYAASYTKTAVAKAIRKTTTNETALQDEHDNTGEASWRERALKQLTGVG